MTTNPIEEPPTDPGTWHIPAYQVPQPPRRKRHVGRWILTGLGAFVLFIVLVSAFGVKHPAASVGPAPTPSAVTSPVKLPTVSASVSTLYQLKSWASGAGYEAYKKVATDLTQDTADVEKVTSETSTIPDVSGIETDGAQLQADTQRAATMPPPVDGPQYTMAMDDYAQAGSDMAVGNFTDAGTWFNQGNTLITQVTAAIKKLS